MDLNKIQQDYRIVLASASPRRREILMQAGLVFEIFPSKKEEHITKTKPEQVVMELSAQKAEDVFDRLQADTASDDRQQDAGKNLLVIGADTIVAYEDRILGKPKDEKDAFRMLRMLQGNRHQVYTGVTLVRAGRTVTFYERTDVSVYPMTDEEIRAYIDTKEPMDKAGAYGIQGKFAVYISGITGDYLNVVGLPLARLMHELQGFVKKPRIGLVATDIDGTLVKESSPEVDPEVPKLLHELTKRGVLCCVASGRQYYSIRSMFADIADEIVYIAENGAHIVYQGRDLSVTQMEPELAKKIIEVQRSYGKGYDFVVSTPEGSLVESKEDSFVSLIRDGYRNRMEVVDDVLAGNPRIMKTALFHKGSIRDIGEKELIPAWKDKVKVCMAGEEWVDFMDASVDKGNAIRFLQDYFKIGYDRTMTFGDNENDIGLMEAAGESYAVENARDVVKKAAKHICPDYTQKGVCQVLRNLLDEISDDQEDNV